MNTEKEQPHWDVALLVAGIAFAAAWAVNGVAGCTARVAESSDRSRVEIAKTLGNTLQTK